ncbi:MAG: tetratricopeptide repeat protein [Mariprofundaceae bacterium]|nr:tetratricopeptide repeat protein [Mariprofundaceae bacterium]
MRALLASLCLLIWLSSCGGPAKPYIDNPYENQMKDFTHMGVKAMHEGRWKPAEHAFARALQMAQLLSDPALEARAWYNDAMAWKAMGDMEKAKDALQQGLRIAHRHQLTHSAQRAQIQWVLLHEGQGILPTLEKTWPADMALSLGYGLSKQEKFQQAQQAYTYVLHHANDEKSGLLLKARAMLGLAMLSKHIDSSQYIPWAKKASIIFRQVGAPQKTAQTLLIIASDQHYTLKQRQDAAIRAQTTFHILQNKHGEKQAQDILQSMALFEEGEHE